MSGPAPRSLVWLILLAVLAYRVCATWKAAHEASRRWSIRTATWWALLLLAVDLLLIGLALAASPALHRLYTATTPPEPSTSRVAGLLTAGLLATAVRKVPFGRSGDRTSLQQYIVLQIERTCYDKADGWIYGEVYPVITGAKIKPFLSAIRGYLENQPGPNGQLDPSYIGKLIDSPNPTMEDIRAACHRMLARSGRKRLMAILAEYRGTRGRRPGRGRRRLDEPAVGPADTPADQ